MPEPGMPTAKTEKSLIKQTLLQYLKKYSIKIDELITLNVC
jgi:hypothetical protein